MCTIVGTEMSSGPVGAELLAPMVEATNEIVAE